MIFQIALEGIPRDLKVHHSFLGLLLFSAIFFYQSTVFPFIHNYFKKEFCIFNFAFLSFSLPGLLNFYSVYHGFE